MRYTKNDAGHYVREDGIEIRKSEHVRGFWMVYLPNGERACSVIEGEPQPWNYAGAPSLSSAKLLAEDITPDTPAYKR
jgi:hypothetical protein